MLSLDHLLRLSTPILILLLLTFPSRHAFQAIFFFIFDKILLSIWSLFEYAQITLTLQVFLVFLFHFLILSMIQYIIFVIFFCVSKMYSCSLYSLFWSLFSSSLYFYATECVCVPYNTSEFSALIAMLLVWMKNICHFVKSPP